MSRLHESIIDVIESGLEVANSLGGYVRKDGDNYFHQSFYRSTFVSDRDSVIESFIQESVDDINKKKEK